MYGIKLIRRAMQLQEVERTPWVPFVGCHGAHLLGVDASSYLRSSDLIVQGVSRAVELYRPDGIPVVFDLQIEAEALGCELAWADENPPAVVSHPLAMGKSLESLELPTADQGRIGMSLDAAARLKAEYPDLAVYGLITGPFTLALHLLGTDIFMKMFEDPDYVSRLMEFSRDTAIRMAEWYIDAGCDVVALVDPMVSQIDPMSFETFVSPYVTAIFDRIRQRGALSSFFVCGHAQQNIEVMCRCKPDNISIDENIPLDFVRDTALPLGVSFGGNMRLTVVLLMGTADDSAWEALDCLEAGGQKGFILAPGCDLPMKTPVENIEAVARMVHDAYSRDVLRTMGRKEKSIERLDLSSHWKTDKVVIDVITLDSASCAPCQYMVEAVKHACASFGQKVEWKEYKIKDQEGIQMMASLGVHNLPTICIDGEICFISQIPPLSELERAIEAKLSTKPR